jgi:tetratricopeptide (TPR) repeat protein
MTSESPFFLTKIECPICKTINEYETIRVGAYTERDRDTDFCPTERIWRNPRYQSFNPLLYFTSTCEHCFYTREFNNSYKSWNEDSYFKTYRLKVVKSKHLNMLAEADSPIRLIGEALDANRYPNETAILKMILAILDECFNDRKVDLDLGRFYLRIGWLFREKIRGANPQETMIKGFMTEIYNRLKGLDRSLETFGDQVSELEQTLVGQFNDTKLSADMKSSLMPIQEKYTDELNAIKELIDNTQNGLISLRETHQEHKEASLGVSDDDSVPGFHSYPSFRDFLILLADKIEGIPLNEKDALTLAVKHYKQAFENGKEISPGNQQIQATYLIAELSRRIGDFDQAKEYFNNTIRTGQEFVYRHKGDQSRTALARKILELAIEQGRNNMAETTAG